MLRVLSIERSVVSGVSLPEKFSEGMISSSKNSVLASSYLNYYITPLVLFSVTLIFLPLFCRNSSNSNFIFCFWNLVCNFIFL